MGAKTLMIQEDVYKELQRLKKDLGYLPKEEKGFRLNPFIVIFSTIGALVCLLPLRKRLQKWI